MSGKILIFGLIALTGCATRPQRAEKRAAPDWSAAREPEHATEKIGIVPEPPALAPPPAAAPIVVRPHTNSYAETWIPLLRWSRDNRIGSLKRIAVLPSPTFLLSTANGALAVQVNSLVAHWNGTELHLGFPPQLIDEQPYVHALDLKKNIEPLLHSLTLPSRPDRVVVIDPGHGGTNTGTKSIADGTEEKDFTLDWAKRLEPLLTNDGWRVFLTRTNDADFGLGDRVAFADAHKADLFISLHFNSAAPNQTQSGLETFCVTPTGMASTLTREYKDNPELVYTNNVFDEQNLQYALRLHRAVLRVSGTADRGVRRARFLTVLRGQSRPAVLIEGGYLSNPQEARRIADPEYRQKLADAVAEALRIDPAPPTEAGPAAYGAGKLSGTNAPVF